MSHSSLSYQSAADQPARQASPRAQSAAAISRHVQHTHNGYTLTHAGHQIRIGPVAFWIVVGALVVMAVWSVATGTYFAFRDNVLAGRNAIRLRGSHRRIACAGRPHHEPPETKHGSTTKRSIPSGFCGRDCGSAISSARRADYSTSSTFSGPPPKAFCASAACMNSSRSPSSTPAVFDVETPVRKSFTI
jgi:hypothetical protein